MVGQILLIQHRRKELITCLADCKIWKPYTGFMCWGWKAGPRYTKAGSFHLLHFNWPAIKEERCFPDIKDGPSLETWVQCGAGIKQVRGRIWAVLARWRSIAFSPSWQSCQVPLNLPIHNSPPLCTATSLHTLPLRSARKDIISATESPRSSFHRPLSLVAFCIKSRRWLKRCTST